MKYRVVTRLVLIGVLCFFGVSSVTEHSTATPRIAKESVPQNSKATPLMTKELAGLAGKEAVMLTVEYAPGASSSKHRHNAHTFVYVLEGSIVMQVEGGKETTLG